MSMPTTARPQQSLRSPASESRPAHRGRDHRHGSRRPSFDGPWLAWQNTEGRGEPGRNGPDASALQQEVLELRRRVKKLRALLRLVLTLLGSSGFTLTHERLL